MGAGGAFNTNGVASGDVFMGTIGVDDVAVGDVAQGAVAVNSAAVFMLASAFVVLLRGMWLQILLL